MCGIAAIITLDAPGLDQPAGPHDQELVGVLEFLRHRGDPDHACETHSEGRFSLGTNRLAIVDRLQAKQPMHDDTGQVWLVFSGELYGFQTLRAKLHDRGYQFRTHSDTEVVLACYLEWGPSFLEKLNGMFAFVLYDARDGSFLAARDHVGMKPLYYQHTAGVYRFASEQKGLLGWQAPIRTVAPGSYIRNGSEIQYFHLDERREPRSSRDAAREFGEVFDEVVKEHVDTDLPLAVPFSGGIDSAAVLQAVQRHHGDVTAFTVGFKGAADVEVATRYCNEFGVRHEIVYLSPSSLLEIVPDVVYGAEQFETVDVIDACTQYMIYQAVNAHGIKVAVCGDGSDEILAGYDIFKTHEDPDALMRYRVQNLYRTDLQRVDRSSMMNSVEARVPFMDRRVLELAYSSPMTLKLRDGTDKWLLREAMRDRLPGYIVDRPKVRMPDGTDIKNRVIEYARQHATADRDVAESIGITSPEGAYFLDLYLRAGFPTPTERFKRAGDDYASNGYFNFVT